MYASAPWDGVWCVLSPTGCTPTIPPNPSLPQALNRFRTYFTSLPLVTRTLLVITVSIHVARSLAGGRPPVEALCLGSPSRPLRLLTAPFTHAGWLHLLFNAWAFAPTAAVREATVGSAGFGCEVVGMTLASGLLFWALAAALTAATRHATACSVGASSLVFALLQADAAGPTPPPPVVVGAVRIPPRLYPSLLAAAIQVLVPHVSAAGHAAGLLAGEAAGAVRRHAPHVLAAVAARADGWTPRAITYLPGWSPPTGHAGLPVSVGDAPEPPPTVPGAGLAARASALFVSLRGGGGDGSEYQPLTTEAGDANPFPGTGDGHVLGGGASVAVLPPSAAAAAAAAARAASAQQQQQQQG